jgi:hypothetical protein
MTASVPSKVNTNVYGSFTTNNENWKQHKYTSAGKWIKIMAYLYIEHWYTIKMNKITSTRNTDSLKNVVLKMSDSKEYELR